MTDRFYDYVPAANLVSPRFPFRGRGFEGHSIGALGAVPPPGWSLVPFRDFFQRSRGGVKALVAVSRSSFGWVARS